MPVFVTMDDDFDFAEEEFENLKRKLYDRLKQGCLRLGYRPNRDLLLQKHINLPDYHGELSYGVEPSECSTLTDRTNSAKSETFYMCDGQWRSGDWQSVGVTTVTKRQNSTTLVRRRRMNVAPLEPLDDDFEERVSVVSQFNTIQAFLPWFLPWILTVLTFLLAQKPRAHELQRRRRESNLKKVRSEQRRTTRARSCGMKSILPNRNSSLLLLVKSFPSQSRRSSTDASQNTRTISRQCAGVARVNRMPITGLPPRPRLIMTPPTSPRNRTDKDEGVSKSSSPATTPSPQPNITLTAPQPFKILSQSPKKVVIEVEKVEHLEGLLSQHFARRDSPTAEEMVTLCQDNKQTDDALNSVSSKTQERCLVSCSGRSVEDMTSNDRGERHLERQSSSESHLSRKAQAIKILKAKKARERELSGSKDSQGSLDRVAARLMQNLEGRSKNASDIEPSQYSVSSSLPDEFVNSQSGSASVSTDAPRLEQSMSYSSSGSSVTGESELPDLSTQTFELMRRNSTVLAKDPHGSFNSSITKWSSIDEESTRDLEESLESDVTEKLSKPEEPKECVVRLPFDMLNPEMKPSLPKPGVSPFASAPKPRKTRSSSFDASSPPASSPPKNKAIEECVTEPRNPMPKRPPPPPPKPKTRKLPECVNKPPPPTKGTVKGQKGKAPPPPPPGDKKKTEKGGRGICRSTEVIEMFQVVRKISKGKIHSSKRKPSKSSKSEKSKIDSQGSGGDSLIKELERNSTYFAQIQSDVETYGPEINKRIEDINVRKFETMSEMNSFVKEVDSMLAAFADETAVLRHFEWPPKYYVYREALALWTELSQGREKCRNWNQGNRGITIELDKMKRHMERNIRRMDEVQRTLEAEVKKFIRNGIPWDSSVLQKVHDGTMTLLEKYMTIVYDEVNRTLTRTPHREKNLNFLTDTINLTFKIHQSVGGLTESCTTLFEKIAALTRTLTDL